MKEYDAAIIGGGPAGSFCALLLASEGYNVCLFERKTFPREILCGEFLSYEVSNHLKDAGIFEKFLDLQPNKVTSFGLFTSEGNSLKADLRFTAFGLKRSTLDNFLLTEAAYRGVRVYQPYSVDSVKKDGDKYIISSNSSDKIFSAGILIGAYGKRNKIDKTLGRKFSEAVSPYNGIKLHLNSSFLKDFPKNETHIYTGENIYCGVNVVNDKRTTICFLEKRREYDPPVKERLLLFINSNPFFRRFYCSEVEESILNEKVYGAGNIYFGRKVPVESGIFMIGDAAGIIAPLAGDGLGMAFESAKLLAEIFNKSFVGKIPEADAYKIYSENWRKKFNRRIKTAGIIQKIIFRKHMLNTGMKLLNIYPRSINKLIDYTRK